MTFFIGVFFVFLVSLALRSGYLVQMLALFCFAFVLTFVFLFVVVLGVGIMYRLL